MGQRQIEFKEGTTRDFGPIVALVATDYRLPFPFVFFSFSLYIENVSYKLQSLCYCSVGTFERSIEVYPGLFLFKNLSIQWSSELYFKMDNLWLR